MPGILMATAAGVDSAAVAWSHNYSAIMDRIAPAATTVLGSLAQLREFVLGVERLP